MIGKFYCEVTRTDLSRLFQISTDNLLGLVTIRQHNYINIGMDRDHGVGLTSARHLLTFASAKDLRSTIGYEYTLHATLLIATASFGGSSRFPRRATFCVNCF